MLKRRKNTSKMSFKMEKKEKEKIPICVCVCACAFVAPTANQFSSEMLFKIRRANRDYCVFLSAVSVDQRVRKGMQELRN